MSLHMLHIRGCIAQSSCQLHQLNLPEMTQSSNNTDACRRLCNSRHVLAKHVHRTNYIAFQFNDTNFLHHRLRGSASPVLTATYHSYGSPRLSDFFSPLGSGGQTPQWTFTQNGSNHVFSRKDVPFAVKVATFHTPWSPGFLKGQNFANFWT